MPPIALSRRHFLGCSAAAGLALSQGRVVDGSAEPRTIRLGVIGLGTRGTALLRSLLELPGVEIAAVADIDPRHRQRGQGITEKARGTRPEAYEHPGGVLERADVQAVAVALPCDLHAEVYLAAIRAGKHLYAEKPLAPTLAECDAIVAGAAGAPEVVVHVGYQRRSNPRYREGVDLIRGGELGPLVEASASWLSSNGPMNGHENWLARRSRSGDWMVEQAVHVWDLFHWIVGTPPARAFGQGRRDLFALQQPARDVTDHYSVQLEWADGFRATFAQSWIAPADERFTGVTQQVIGDAGGLDFGSGALTFRDKSRPRQTLHPGTQPDTRLALQAFVQAVRRPEPSSPPVSLAEARAATLTGLLVRKAVDERRVVSLEEVQGDVAV